MQLNLTVSQVYIQILLDRGFNQTQIAKLCKVHRVTITNIANLYYTGNTSEKKIEQIISQIELSNDEINLIRRAMLHLPITVSDNEEAPTQVNQQLSSQVSNAPTIAYNNAPSTDEIINQQNVMQVITQYGRNITQQNVNLVIHHYANRYGTCMFCKRMVQHNCTAGFYRGKFTIMCHDCRQKYHNSIEPIPPN